MDPVAELTFEDLIQRLRRRHFGVLSTADAQGRPQAAGIVYAVSHERTDFYAMTRTHLQKARNLVVTPHVALVVPLIHLAVPFLPPPCIQFQGTAQILDRSDASGRAAFESFLLGGTICRAYRELERRGETRVCFVRIRPGPVMFAYAVPTPLWRLVADMERGAAKVVVPVEHRG